MKLGSVEHKELFCRSLTESYREYEAESLPWPDLDDAALSFLRSIPFWEKALDTERQAGAIVNCCNPNYCPDLPISPWASSN